MPLKKSLKKTETRIKMEIVEVLQQARNEEILGFDLVFLARITLTLISSFTITGYFQKLDFQLFNLVILKFELLSAFLYALCELLEE